jgi:hypothetical protein
MYICNFLDVSVYLTHQEDTEDGEAVGHIGPGRGHLLMHHVDLQLPCTVPKIKEDQALNRF